MRGHDDDGGITALAQLAADLDAVQVRQLQIEQDDIGLTPGERLVTRHHMINLVTAPGQAANELRGNAGVVLYYQHAGARVVRLSA